MDKALLAPVRKALNALEWHAGRIVQRWLWALTKVRNEGGKQFLSGRRITYSRVPK
ncbi:hypothetical protein ACPF7Z_10520 [Halomonas sp. GXIMD04776]